MKKLFAILFVSLFVLMSALPLAFTAGAAEGNTVVYLKDGGNGDGKTPETAVGDLPAAYDALDLSLDCTVVVCDVFTQEWIFNYEEDYTGSVTFTSLYGGVDYRTAGAAYKFQPCRFVCFGETKFENMNFEALKTNILIIGQHNPVTIGEGVVMSGDASQFTGGSIAKAFCILGGYQKDQNDPPLESDRDTHITVLSGNTLYIVPFSRSLLGTYSGTAYVTVGGNADVTVLHGSAAYPNGVMLGDLKVEITGNAHVKNFYGCTQNTTLNSAEIIWKSGTIDVFEWNCSYTPDAAIAFNQGTTLRATETVKTQEKFAKIASAFDKVETITADYTIETAPADTAAPTPDTDAPATTTAAPADVTTAAPSDTTAAPAATTKAPAATTKAPAATTKAPAATTKAPATTTKAPDIATKAPGATTKAPAVTTAAPAVDNAGGINPIIIIAAAAVVIAVVVVIIVASKKKK